MDARPLALVAGVALAALLFLWLQRDLARGGAGWRPRVAVAAVFGVMAVLWSAVLVARIPTWPAWLATIAALGVTVGHRRLVEWLGGRPPERQLAAEIGAIRAGLSVLTTSRYERARLRSQARRLDRWRNTDGPIADELVDLVQEDVLARLDAGPASDPEREARIRELLGRLER
jgi:hypothetical protein